MAYTKNYYSILGLGASSLTSPTAPPKSPPLRRAYRNALLAAHPDKQRSTRAVGYTVDDVKEAYAVLDDPGRRREYDAWILRNPEVLSTQGSVAQGVSLSRDFVLGLEALDLSDFEEVEDGRVEGEGVWMRACRCGDLEGFRILEVDLVDAEQRGEGEVLVGCGGCSLWVRVGFEVEEG